MAFKLAAKSANPKAKHVFSVKSLIFGLMLTASLVPLGVFTVMNYQQSREQTLAMVEHDLVQSNQANGQSVSLWIAGGKLALRGAATSDELTSMKAESAQAYINKVNTNIPLFTNLTVSGTDGQQIARTGGGKLINIADRTYFTKPMAGEDHSQGLISRNTNRANLFSGTAIRNQQNEIVGVLAGLVDMSEITDKITGKKIGQTGFSYLVGETGKIVAHPDLKKVDTELPAYMKELFKHPKKDHMLDLTDETGKEIALAMTEADGFVLISQIDRAEVLKPLVKQRTVILALFGAAVALIVVLAGVFSQAISSKMTQLASLAERISGARSEKELTLLEARLGQVKGVKEVQMLTESMRKLTASIKIAMRAV